MDDGGTTVLATGLRLDGPLTWRESQVVRERVHDLLDGPGAVTVWLDVRDVTDIDRVGVAVLIGAHHRAHALGRELALIDDGGPVEQGLLRHGGLDRIRVVAGRLHSWA
ncbi:MAG: STAS domain-containing protein [Frankiales bacterium]|nr:STAS domain-containing protein [Frankiales bacterium]